MRTGRNSGAERGELGTSETGVGVGAVAVDSRRTGRDWVRGWGWRGREEVRLGLTIHMRGGGGCGGVGG